MKKNHQTVSRKLDLSSSILNPNDDHNKFYRTYYNLCGKNWRREFPQHSHIFKDNTSLPKKDDDDILDPDDEEITEKMKPQNSIPFYQQV